MTLHDPTDSGLPFEIKGGMERCTFTLGIEAVRKAAQESQGDSNKLKRALSQHYPYDPRPSYREVLQISIKQDGSNAEVEMIIARGHYAISELLRTHIGTVHIESGGRVTCDCHPGQEAWLPRGATVAWPEFLMRGER